MLLGPGSGLVKPGPARPGPCAPLTAPSPTLLLVLSLSSRRDDSSVTDLCSPSSSPSSALSRFCLLSPRLYLLCLVPTKTIAVIVSSSRLLRRRNASSSSSHDPGSCCFFVRPGLVSSSSFFFFFLFVHFCPVVMVVVSEVRVRRW
ncbi:hypothetical protein PIB30_052813 [Stylosanthes scabra]|uniref:Uncharacterized protein n=1 Tax=Stylosanthes scabra TaxID=79078 RepID=A0ABU6XIK1_9FABA|nr:hypothetical protein [Stylosanthes scabra]